MAPRQPSRSGDHSIAPDPNRSGRELGKPSSELTHIAWVPNKELALSEWSSTGRRLGSIVRCSQWWLGDWIRYGNTKFGERYTRAAILTGYDVQTLTNMAHVASRFELHRRRANLSWSHHAALAALNTEDQDRWLDRAMADKLSVADLRCELRSHSRPAKPTAQPTAALTGFQAKMGMSTCPNCGAPLPMTALAARPS
jgi:hypothetical protein